MANELLITMGAGSDLEEFYPAIAINSLMRILKDQSLQQHHVMAVQALIFVFKSLGIKSVTYLPQVAVLSWKCQGEGEREREGGRGRERGRGSREGWCWTIYYTFLFSLSPPLSPLPPLPSLPPPSVPPSSPSPSPSPSPSSLSLLSSHSLPPPR